MNKGPSICGGGEKEIPPYLGNEIPQRGVRSVSELKVGEVGIVKIGKIICPQADDGQLYASGEPISVYRAVDGRYYVSNGAHRYYYALRSGAKSF